jgi:hypothetical protein
VPPETENIIWSCYVFPLPDEFINDIRITADKGDSELSISDGCVGNSTCLDKPPADGKQRQRPTAFYEGVTFIFTPPIENPVLAVLSMGIASQPQNILTLSEDGEIYCNTVVSGRGNCGDYGSGSIAMPDPKTVVGTEAYGIIKFTGTYSSISVQSSGGQDAPFYRWGKLK